MATNFWFKFNYKDWSNDVKPLSLTARGLLIELIIYMEEHNGEIENDINLIVRLSGGLTEEITESLTEFKKFAIVNFDIIDGKEFLVSRRIKKKLALSIQNQLNGSKGGNPRLSEAVKQIDNREDNRTPISNLYLNNNKDMRQVFFNDFENSSELENICMDLKKTKQEVLLFMPKFLLKANPTYINFKDFTSHYKRCFVIELLNPIKINTAKELK